MAHLNEIIDQRVRTGRIKKVNSFSNPTHRKYDPVQVDRIQEFSRSKVFLALELGCGTGMHALAFARKNPDWNIVAIEKTREKSSKFLKQWELSQLENLLPVHDNAIDWLSQHFSGPVADAVFILYPNPYPKSKQANKRWHNMPFMSWLIHLLKPQGSIVVATNEKWYLDECRSQMQYTWNMGLKFSEEISPKHEPRTLFEKKYLLRQGRCYQDTYFKKF